MLAFCQWMLCRDRIKTVSHRFCCAGLYFPSLTGGWHPEGSPAGWNYCLAQENPRGHVHAPVPSWTTREYGLPATGVPGSESRHSHHDSPPQPGPVWGWRKQSQHPGGRSQQSGQPVPHGPRLAPLALRRQQWSEDEQDWEDDALLGLVSRVALHTSDVTGRVQGRLTSVLQQPSYIYF